MYVSLLSLLLTTLSVAQQLQLPAEDDHARMYMCIEAQINPRLCQQIHIRTACACTCDRYCRLQRRHIANERIAACCEGQGVPQKCMRAVCHYDFSAKTLRDLAEDCFPFYERAMYCAADGYNNDAAVMCCQQRNISEPCLSSFCRGDLPRPCDFDTKHFRCASDDHVWDILTCLQDNIAKKQGWIEESWTTGLSSQDLQCLNLAGFIPDLLNRLGISIF